MWRLAIAGLCVAIPAQAQDYDYEYNGATVHRHVVTGQQCYRVGIAAQVLITVRRLKGLLIAHPLKTGHSQSAERIAALAGDMSRRTGSGRSD
jgi:hypothetical protein